MASNYDFLKTGLICGSGVVDSQVQSNISALILSFSEKSLRLAATFAKHKITNKDVVTVLDIQCAMAVYYFQVLEDPDLEDNFNKWTQILQEDDENSNDDVQEDDDDCCTCSTNSDNEEIIDEGLANEKTICKMCNKQIFWDIEEQDEPNYKDEDGQCHECTCQLCKEFENAIERLNSYSPQNNLECILKHRILQDLTTAS